MIKIARMKRYFDNLTQLLRFVRSLDCQPAPVRCQHCAQSDQWVAHDAVYKKQHQAPPRAVGKRIFCSNRYGRSGCGRTTRFYLTSGLARLHYSATHLTAFVLALLSGVSIQQAYTQATGSTDPRNAYRWLHKLQHKIIDLRTCLDRAESGWRPFQTHSKQRLVLITTLQRLVSVFGKDTCAQYQQQTQTTFI